MLYPIEYTPANQDYLDAWSVAGNHLYKISQGSINWLKADPIPPFLEHLSFRLGNKTFFVRLIDVDDQADFPGSEDGLKYIAKGWNSNAYLMPMKKVTGTWEVQYPDWGLIDFNTRNPTNPVDLVSDEKIIMTDWELLDFSVLVVKTNLKNSGYEITSSSANPDLDPSIWFVKDGKSGWVIVRADRYPAKEAKRPNNISQTIEYLKEKAPKSKGYFASVCVVSVDEEFIPNTPTPLFRGYGMHARYVGLEGL